MPDKPLFHPNERVDLGDMTHASTSYTDARARFDTVKQLLGKRAQLLEGFRVEIADQAASPGQISVHNGTALDVTGRHVNNEDQVNDVRDIVLLGATQTYFLEVEYREEESTSDGRAFWDPSFDNVAPELDGKEFNINATTRVTPNWQIVTPVSTTGFDIESNPASTRIPLVMLSTDGASQVDTAAPGLVQVVVSNVVEEDILAAVSSVRLLDSRLFADSGTIDLDFGGASVETVAFSSNNRATGVLTLGAPTANAHLAGEIVRVNGSTPRFIQQRTDAIPDVTGATEPDVARRLFQGSEIRGSALVSSKETFGGRDDLGIETMKDRVDAMSSLLRELKFGNLRTDSTNAVLPTTFTSTRYYDSAGGVAGARSATITIGDGINTLGDFNGADEAPFQAAIDFLIASPAGAEAAIVVKAGTYTFTQAVTTASATRIAWVGEGTVNLVMDSATDAMFDMSNVEESRWTNINFTKTGVASQILILNDLNFCSFHRCLVVSGRMELDGNADAFLRITDSFFNSTAVTAGLKMLVADFDRIEIDETEINVAAGSDGFALGDGGENCRLTNVYISVDGAGATGIELAGTGHGIVTFRNLILQAANGAGGILAADSHLTSNLSMDNCTIVGLGTLDIAHRSLVQLGIVGSATINGLLMTGDVTDTSTQGSFSWGFADSSPQLVDYSLTFANCQFIELTSAATGMAIFSEVDATLSNRYHVAVRDCVFAGGLAQMVVHRNGSLTVDNCEFDGSGATGNTVICVSAGCVASAVGSVQDVTIKHSRFRNISSDLPASVSHSPISIAGPVVPSVENVTNLVIDGNVIENVGNNTTCLSALGISVVATTPLGRATVINNRLRFIVAAAGGIVGGIAVDGFNSNVFVFTNTETTVAHNDLTFIGLTGVASAVSAGISVNPGGLGTGALTNCNVAYNHVAQLKTTNPTLGAIYVACGNDSFGIDISHNNLRDIGQQSGVLLGSAALQAVISGDTSHVTITRNEINTTTSASTIPISVSYTSDTGIYQGLTIDNNRIAAHAAGYSILVVGTNTAPGANTPISGMSVSNNCMDGMSQIFHTGQNGFILCSLLNVTNGRFDGNSMFEIAANAGRFAIVLNFNAASLATIPSQNISVSNNKAMFIAGVIHPAANIIVNAVKTFIINGNIIGANDDDNTGLAMPGILVSLSQFGYVVSNFLAGGPGAFAIDISVTSENVAVAHNMLHAANSFLGTINVPGPNCFGSGTTATLNAININRLV